MKIHDSIDISKDIYFEEHLSSHVINDIELAKRLLTDNRVSADRLSIKFQYVDQKNPYIQSVIDFYRNWLMYMEGESHKMLRNACLKHLNTVVKQFNFYSYIKIKCENYFIKDKRKDVSLFIEDLVSSLIAEIIGIKKDEYIKLIEKSKDIVTFLYSPSPLEEEAQKVLQSINFTKEFLEEIYYSEGFKENSILHEMKKADMFSLDIVINILVDGHDPLCSALNTVVLNYFQNDFSLYENIKYSLKYYPPFTHCVRVATAQIELPNEYVIKDGDYIFIVLPQHEKCPFSNHEAIPFGYGGHTCLGKKMTEESLKGLINSFNDLSMKKLYNINNYNINDLFGYYSFTSVTISKSS